MRTTRDARHTTLDRRRPLLPSPLRPLRGRNKAFTLIEMIIVIAIISALLALLYGALERAQKFSRRTITYTELKNIESAFKQYHAHYHAWPSNSLAVVQFESGDDRGFIIDERIAALLQGNQIAGVSAPDIEAFNPEMIPFIEFSRYSPVTRAPANPFKPNNPGAPDTTRAYKVLFDTNGDRQIRIEDSEAPGFNTNIIANVAVWTIISGTRKNDAAGNPEPLKDEIFGTWDSFSIK
ncbi:MAG: prepilin-type N-terminal cleavage/methylation domain-containing protein [Kiritimatiellae bacterium]|nr:prepilin-type N-terminal cleavage/methylation domain-containing protein [Kiritimatiellia bacterium]